MWVHLCELNEHKHFHKAVQMDRSMLDAGTPSHLILILPFLLI